MSDQLFPYQRDGVEWLKNRKTALLADEMGLGKSAQAVTAADAINAKRILILCPAIARENWKREFALWTTTPRQFFKVEDRSTPIPEDQSVICSYDLAHSTKIPGNFDLLILDEAHYLKSVNTKRSKAVYGREGLVRRASKVWCLSGTPAPNHPGELWPLLYTFGATKLSYDDFIQRYCVGWHGPHGFAITGSNSKNIPELAQILKSIMLRRKKSEVMKDLPEIYFRSVLVPPGEVDLDIESSFTKWVIPTDRKKELFDLMEKERMTVETLLNLTGDSTPGLRGLEALSPSVSTLRRYVGLQKVQAVAELVEQELSDFAYEKVVIFAIHRDVIEGLRTRLRKFGVVTLYGGHDPLKAYKNVEHFQKNPKIRVFVGNIISAGTAITLTAAHNVIFAEQDWVPGNNAQAAMRCHRIGQTNPVLVRIIGLENSFDERVNFLLKRKIKELTQLFENP